MSKEEIIHIQKRFIQAVNNNELDEARLPFRLAVTAARIAGRLAQNGDDLRRKRNRRRL